MLPTKARKHTRSSPRARGVLFTFLRPKGLIVPSRAEFYAEFRNAILIKIRLEGFSQFDFEVRYPLPQKRCKFSYIVKLQNCIHQKDNCINLSKTPHNRCMLCDKLTVNTKYSVIVASFGIGNVSYSYIRSAPIL